MKNNSKKDAITRPFFYKSLIFNCYFTSHLIQHYQTISSLRCYRAISQPFQPLVGLSVERKIQ